MAEVSESDVDKRKSLSQRIGSFCFGLFRFSMKLILVLLFVAGGFLVGGFFKFASVVTTPSDELSETADGIVVLTGGRTRIERALELLDKKQGNRLLISGVNPATSAEAIKKNNPKHAALFDCCVDVESVAEDTVGNAAETRNWAREKNYQSIILVTSNYHMPRSLLEFRRQMPEAKIIAYSVDYAGLQQEEWWKDSDTLRFMLSEYVKYVGAGGRDFVNPETLSALRASLTGA